MQTAVRGAQTVRADSWAARFEADRMTERLLTAREVADRLGVSTETVLRWTRRGEMPAFKLPGGAIRYRDVDLDDWLRVRATCPATLQATRSATPERVLR